jgi:hypothetical protein
MGFFDLAVAAPSMRAALEAWGVTNNLFHQGMAIETDDPATVAATMASPGVVLKRPVGSKAAFSDHATLPTAEAFGRKSEPQRNKPAPRAKSVPVRKIDEKAARKAALKFEAEQRQREVAQKKEEAATAKAREWQQAVVSKAQHALDEAETEHSKRANKIEAERNAIEKRAQTEKDRWEKQRAQLQQVLRNARDQ